MARLSRLRGQASFRRRPGHKPPRTITLIVCEGDTEREYFEAARIHYGLSSAEVVVAENTQGSAPISVVQCAERKAQEAGGYDRIFCVFDRDGHESFHRARERIAALAARKKRPLSIAEAVSIPCFELWVLLHFERTDASFGNCAAVIQRIREQHDGGYRKADARTSRQLIAHVNAAMENAVWLEGRAEENDWNPYTSVHSLLRHLARAAGEGDVA